MDGFVIYLDMSLYSLRVISELCLNVLHALLASPCQIKHRLTSKQVQEMLFVRKKTKQTNLSFSQLKERKSNEPELIQLTFLWHKQEANTVII